MKYGIALFGSILYNYILFVIAKGNCENNGVDFEYGKYLKMNWDNWLLTLFLAPVLVLYLPDIVALLNDKMAWNLKVYGVYNLGAGPLTEFVLFLMFKLIGWKNSWVAPVHK